MSFVTKVAGGGLVLNGAFGVVAGAIAAPATGGLSLIASAACGVEAYMGGVVWNSEPKNG